MPKPRESVMKNAETETIRINCKDEQTSTDIIQTANSYSQTVQLQVTDKNTQTEAEQTISVKDVCNITSTIIEGFNSVAAIILTGFVNSFVNSSLIIIDNYKK